MKIDKATIDYNIHRMVKEIAGEWIYEGDEEDNKMQALLSIAEIKGMCEFAETMREVLDS